MNKKLMFFLMVLIGATGYSQTLQTVLSNGNSSTLPIRISGRTDLGELYDPAQYGAVQIVRSTSQGSGYHLSFVRSGSMIYGMGFPNNSDNFAIQPGASNLTTAGIFMNISGYVGIGTTTLTNPLSVPITNSGQGISLGTYASLNAGQFAFIGLTGANGTFNNGNLSAGDNGSTGMAIVHTSGGLGNSAEIAFVTHNNGSDSKEHLRIDRLGNVGIGTITPSEKLSVNGKIRAREVKVETANWPDYVFAKEYELPSLQSTEQQIKEKGHLPGIPSAAEVKANGVDLGEMNAKLLQKIEELTLHLIEQSKRTRKLEEIILKSKLN
ncbi:hypothetical protein ACXZ1K_05240 [Pedobacter sp. PWIIR3]